MLKPNPENERQKRAYFTYLREAHGRDEATIDRVAASLARFEMCTNSRDFRRFHREQAVAFKGKLGEALNCRTGERLSKSTLLSTLRDLRAFFLWLAQQPGYRSKIAYSDADYFNLSDKDAAVARASRKPDPPTVEQMQRVLEAMPIGTVFERRDRAVVAAACLTGARAKALVTLRLGHVHLDAGFIDQDARFVDTKFAKTIRADFHRLVPSGWSILSEWCDELRNLGWGAEDPLFPQTEMGLSENGAFAAIALARRCWSTSQPVREIFQRAFAAAHMPYKNPHLMRDMLVHAYMGMNLSPAQFKAVSQSLGHSDVLTTLTSYGSLPVNRQSELVRSIVDEASISGDALMQLQALLERLRREQGRTIHS